MGKRKKKVAELFFFFFSAQFLNYIKVKITVTPNRSPCSAWRHKTCNVSFLWYSWTVSQPDSQPRGGWVRVERRGGGGGGECPPSASLLWSSGCRAAAPQCRTSSWAPLDPSSIWSSSPPPQLANRGSLPPTASPTGGVNLSLSLSTLTQRSL